MKIRICLSIGTVLFALTGMFVINKSACKSSVPLINSVQYKGGQLASVADAEQFKKPGVPVVVVSVTSGLSDPDEHSKKQFVVKEVIVENRSNKNVSSVTIRWALSPLNNRLIFLSH